MSTIQNLKNFIRHGKQARANQNPHADPTTSLSPVHAQHQRHNEKNQHAISNPVIGDHKPLQGGAQPPADGYSVANLDNRNVAAQAGAAAGHHAAAGQKIHQSKKQEYDAAVLGRIVAEERESKGKFPKYPGLERFKLLEKMGDGAFSNVYRAQDLQGEFQEVAIKVVRKFEMNQSQVCWAWSSRYIFYCVAFLFYSFCQRSITRATSIYIQSSRSSRRVSRYLYSFFTFLLAIKSCWNRC